MSYALKRAKHKAARIIAHSFYVHVNELKFTVSCYCQKPGRSWYTSWRASEASETLLVVVQWKTRYVYTYKYIEIRETHFSGVM